MTEPTILCGSRQLDGAALRLRADRVASGFASLGLKAGDAVAVMLRNDIPYLETILALDRLGVHLVAVNWHFQAEEIAFLLRDSGAGALVIHADLLSAIKDAVPWHMQVLVVPTPEDIAALYGSDTARLPEDAIAWEAWRDSFAPHAAPAAPKLGSMLYTSGTTGRPKAVMRLPGTRRQHEGALRVRALAGRAREGMRTVVVGPLYHAGPNAAVRVALQMAGLIVVMPRFDAERLLQIIQEHRITHLSMVPVMLVRLLKLPRAVRERYDVSSLENVTHGGSPCAPDVRRQMIDWWGPILCETYGSTETGLVTFATSQQWLERPGTAGRPFPGMDIRILDDGGEPLGAGQVGEICVDVGDNALPFTYRNAPDQRAAIDRNGYIATGDVGHLDADGFLFITDRKRDLVISGGVNIYPAEIEHALVGHPEVADCAVFGVPDDEFGEAVAAAVVRSPGSQISPAQLCDWLRLRLAGYKVPRHVEFHEALPREAMGKVFKHRLRAAHWARAGRQI